MIFDRATFTIPPEVRRRIGDSCRLSERVDGGAVQIFEAGVGV